MQIHWLNTGRQAINYIAVFYKMERKIKELAFQFRYTQLSRDDGSILCHVILSQAGFSLLLHYFVFRIALLIIKLRNALQTFR